MTRALVLIITQKSDLASIPIPCRDHETSAFLSPSPRFGRPGGEEGVLSRVIDVATQSSIHRGKPDGEPRTATTATEKATPGPVPGEL
jgi:hypothetical protein